MTTLQPIFKWFIPAASCYSRSHNIATSCELVEHMASAHFIPYTSPFSSPSLTLSPFFSSERFAVCFRPINSIHSSPFPLSTWPNVFNTTWSALSPMCVCSTQALRWSFLTIKLSPFIVHKHFIYSTPALFLDPLLSAHASWPYKTFGTVQQYSLAFPCLVTQTRPQLSYPSLNPTTFT